MDNREKLQKKIRKIWFKNVDELLTSIEREDENFSKAEKLIEKLSIWEKEILSKARNYRLDFQLQEIREKMEELIQKTLKINF
jgi:hypothetical protein